MYFKNLDYKSREKNVNFKCRWRFISELKLHLNTDIFIFYFGLIDIIKIQYQT